MSQDSEQAKAICSFQFCFTFSYSLLSEYLKLELLKSRLTSIIEVKNDWLLWNILFQLSYIILIRNICFALLLFYISFFILENLLYYIMKHDHIYSDLPPSILPMMAPS